MAELDQIRRYQNEASGCGTSTRLLDDWPTSSTGTAISSRFLWTKSTCMPCLLHHLLCRLHCMTFSRLIMYLFTIFNFAEWQVANSNDGLKNSLWLKRENLTTIYIVVPRRCRVRTTRLNYVFFSHP